MDLPFHAYFKGEIIPYSEAKVGVLTHALNYGTAVFAGLRGYWNQEKEQLFVFRPQDHFRRFLNSAKIMNMEFDHTPESLTQVTIELTEYSGYHLSSTCSPRSAPPTPKASTLPSSSL